MSTKLSPKLLKSFDGKIRQKVKLAPYLAYRMGGPAEYFLEPKNEKDIQKAAQMAKEHSMELHILGAGTNLLVRDGGLSGIVLFLGAGLEGKIKIISEDHASAIVSVPAHYSKAELLDWSLKNKLSGLEFSAGIPGTLGGAVWMNAGTKWGSYSSVIQKVRFFKSSQGFFEKTNQEMGFKYRGHGEGLLDKETVIVSVDIKLEKNKSQEEMRSLVDEILSYRGLRQPLELPNCGSVFKNPENSEKGAGRLIEAAGLKGLKVGKAMVSLKHANFILNLGGAKAKDVEKLIHTVQEKVFEKFSIKLEPEVIILGKN